MPAPAGDGALVPCSAKRFASKYWCEVPQSVPARIMPAGDAALAPRRAGGVSLLQVSQCTPPQRVSRLSVFQGKFDELEYHDWKFEQGHYNFSSNRSNIMRDARNQPEFSYFS